MSYLIEIRRVVAPEMFRNIRAYLDRGDAGLMKAVAEELHRQAMLSFARKRDPWGKPWPPHSPTTKALRAGKAKSRGRKQRRPTERQAARKREVQRSQRNRRARERRIARRMGAANINPRRAPTAPVAPRTWRQNLWAARRLRARMGGAVRINWGRPNRPLLIQSGALRASIRPGSTTHTAWVSTPLKYAGVQHWGNPRNRLPNTAAGSPAPIPARPFFMLAGTPASPVPRITGNPGKNIDRMMTAAILKAAGVERGRRGRR